MCGAHAQVITAAELSVGIRTSGPSLAEVRRALWDDATLVKAFGPRRTVHLLPADDLSLWTGALGAIPPAAAPSGGFLTAAQADEVVEAIAEGLGDGELSVDELGEAVIGRARGPGRVNL
ncbi:DNA glycosylase AlkZ-like family protein [Arthrobacter sp. ISL-5]|uniref:DNA glycosylase AlkZ-like family protein n=1 Tax=Arthrobacter sp. ISL-5 TaxID=2819111 RepID=UPI001BE99E09|nr:crosslink repair DNA glycosylase YcaQ family protein [Arthrobacter sp. ISL-5]MBT2552366.1 winged helix DNA-binding domain-containing protein [Arthrobacter sp. ISL-5]